MAHTFERGALYEEVWSTPLSKLGPKYGLSDNGLRKICKAMNIPLPQVGHWAKLAAGYAVKRTPLSAKADRTSFVTYPPAPREHIDHDDQAWLKERLAFEARPEHHINVPREPEVWHKAIAPLRSALEEAVRKRARDIEARDRAVEQRANLTRRGAWEPNLDHFKYMHLNSSILTHPRLDGCLAVSEATGPTALAIINALFVACEARGFSVGFGDKRRRFRVAVNSSTFYLLLRERQAGELAFNVSRDHLADFTVTGDAKCKLEDQLNRFMGRLYRSIVTGREKLKEHDAWVEQQRLREIAADARREREAIEAAERAAEKARREGLLVETADWQQARLIREYAAAIAAAPVDDQVAQHERVRWCAWALEVADSVCPMQSRLGSFGGTK